MINFLTVLLTLVGLVCGFGVGVQLYCKFTNEPNFKPARWTLPGFLVAVVWLIVLLVWVK